MYENGTISGVYYSRRAFQGAFQNYEISNGNPQGILTLNIDISETEKETVTMRGQIQDAPPARGQGYIYLFRDIHERNKFLLEQGKDSIEIR